MIAGGSTGAFEAPTGLGKSLAALIPAIAHAIVDNKRTVIATYTNVLAEQYWRQDLPLALSLFESDDQDINSKLQTSKLQTPKLQTPKLQTPKLQTPKVQFLIGRQRYSCVA